MYDNLRNRLDFDDLLFEKRNRDYGAYQLRKKYNSVMIGGIIAGTLLVATLVIVPFILANRDDKIHTGGIRYVKVQMENMEPPPEQIIVPQAPPPPILKKTEELAKYVPPVIVDSVPPNEKSLATADELLSRPTNEISEIDGTGSVDDMGLGQDGSDSDEPFFQVEIMPTFKGGDISKFREWVAMRVNYPQEAIDKRIRGTVFLTFIVEKDGTVSNVTVIKGIHELLDKEAARVISESPKWTPGLQRGQPVRIRYSIPLSFTP